MIENRLNNKLNLDAVEQPNSLEKRIFWHYARKHLEEMRLLFRGGRLSRKEGNWNNVIDHCLVQGAEADILADLLGLPEEEKEKLQRTALTHDWKKRMDIEPGDFTEEQKIKVEELLKEASPDPEILDSTEAGFSRKIIDGEASFLQKLMFYMDDITMGSKIVSYQERIAELETRTKFGQDKKLIKKLGGPFWDMERLAARQIEQEIFFLLKAKGVKIGKPEDIPGLIREEVMKKVNFIQPSTSL